MTVTGEVNLRRKFLGRRLVGSLTGWLMAWSAAACHADDASVLPKGVFRAFADTLVYFPITERFNRDGEPEDLASNFTDRALDSSVFPALGSPLLRAALLAVGDTRPASLGDATVSFEYNFVILDFGLQYGITDRLTAGFHIPYWWAENSVQADLNSGPGSSANVGLTAAGNCCVPIVGFGGRPLSTQNIQQLLGPGLGRTPGFNFDPVESWRASGVGDIDAGLKYQYLRTENWALALTTAVRFPTGRQDDPNSLVDIPFGTGAWALLFRLHNDFLASSLWNKRDRLRGPRERLQAGDLLLDAAFEYDLYFPANPLLRVPDNVDNPITNNEERVWRQLGDRFAFSVTGKYQLLSGLSLTAIYRYSFKLQDRVSGNQNFQYGTLEEDTDATEQVYFVGVTYSTVPLYEQKRFPVPLHLALFYRDRFAGSGPNVPGTFQTLKSRYIALSLQVFF